MKKSAINIKKPEKYFVDIFKSAGLTEDKYTFKRIIKDRWEVTCSVCAGDEYVKEGLCTGKFKTTTDGLRLGCSPCRCVKSYRWPQEQREYQLNKIKPNGVKILGWESQKGYENNNTKLIWLCDSTHKCASSVSNLLGKGFNCNSCAKERVLAFSNLNGYYSDKDQALDYLYIISFEGEYLKIGRTFNIPRSLRELEYKSGRSAKVLYIFKGPHGAVYNKEQEIHRHLRNKDYRLHKRLWSKELFPLYTEQESLILLRSSNLEEVCYQQG